jgi:hypothetical protein
MDTNKIIDNLGGTGAVAKLCGVTDGAVSQWRHNGIPKHWRKFLELTAPEVFGLVRPHRPRIKVEK